MRLLEVIRGNDPEAVGVPGGPGGACGLRSERGLVRRWVVTATSEGEPDRADVARAAFRVRR
jgi:hypothetical protein